MTDSDESSVNGSAPDPEIQERLAKALGGKYEVRELLGRGGFAEVYEAWDKDLERRLAIKVLHPEVSWTAGMLARFRQETKTIARLNHPNIIPIHFVAEGEGLLYYAMPFIEGKSLGDVLRTTGALGVDGTISVMRPVLEALQHAHERGLVHRDIKPDNVMIDHTTGRPILMDFGIAKQLGGGQSQTQTGFVVGTPQYMSPEQALGQKDLDARTDLYAIGAVLFQMVTGSPPFEGETSQEVVAKHINEEPPVPMERNAGIPEWLSDVILRCLAKKPDDRYQSARKVVEALDKGRGVGPQDVERVESVLRPLSGEGEPTALLPSEETPATRLSPTEARRAGRRKMLVSLAVGLGLIGGGIGGYLLLGGPSLVIENRLIAPIQITVNGQEVSVVEPGGRFTMGLEQGRDLVAHWSVVQPTTPAGVAMGVPVEGAIVEASPRGTIRGTANNWPADSAFFAPLITNATDQSLEVIVNAGLAFSQSCECIVSPGTVRASIGYYPLFQNSTVQVKDPQGRTAMFSDFAASVEQATGAVGLRFESADLRPPGGR